MVTIIFEAHSPTTDNEAHLASGHNDAELSDLGLQQSNELGSRYDGSTFRCFFCSDMQRSYKTAELAFGDKFSIIRDRRLRECDYGDFTQKPKEIVDTEKPSRIIKPFPNGESYEQTCDRIKSFLVDLLQNYNDMTVMIIGHRATQYGLEHAVNNAPIQDAVIAHWEWQPGWVYQLNAPE